jgi:hypothetical protein
VVYEVLRTGNEQLRSEMIWATALGSWSRLMPEAYREAAEVYELVATHRPEWLVSPRDVAPWYALQADWSGGHWWRRARQDQCGEASRIAVLGGNKLESARAEAKRLRGWAMGAGLTAQSLTLAEIRAGFQERVPGWDGDLVEARRTEGCTRWWEVLQSPAGAHLVTGLTPG